MIAVPFILRDGGLGCPIFGRSGRTVIFLRKKWWKTEPRVRHPSVRTRAEAAAREGRERNTSCSGMVEVEGKDDWGEEQAGMRRRDPQ